MDDEISEKECVLCANIDADRRHDFWETLIEIPLKQGVCDRCLAAFFRNIGFPIADDDPSKQSGS